MKKIVSKTVSIVNCATLVLCILFLWNTAYALTITYDNFTHSGASPIDYIVTINDDTPGLFKFTYEVASTSANTTGKLTGLYFNVTTTTGVGPYNSGNLGLQNQTTSSSDQAFDDTKIGGVTNLNLGEFDVIIGWKSGVDLRNGAVGMFEVSDLGGSVDISDFNKIGLRGQAVGPTPDGGEESAKEIQDTPSAAVPEAATMLLTGIGLISLAVFGRRKIKK
jgi:hypothetical protein